MPENSSGRNSRQHHRHCRNQCQKQRGLAVLLLLLILLTGALGHVLDSRFLQVKKQPVSTSDRIERLQQAKQALIAYSVSYADNYLPGGAGPGHLPCPDRSPVDDGVESNDGPDPPCSRASALVGRFPRFTYSRDPAEELAAANSRYGRKRLVFYAHRSLKDEQMWYVVSRSHINNPANLALNPGTEALLEVDGRRDIVAVIIDPGPQLKANPGLRPGDDIQAYLEGSNADADLQFTQPRDGVVSNDLLVTVSHSELMHGVMQRVGIFVARWLSQYSKQRCKNPGGVCYPPAGDTDGVCQSALQQGRLPLHPGDCGSSLLQHSLLQGVEAARHWFVRNDWPDYLHYSRHPACAHDTERRCVVRLSIDEPGERSRTSAPGPAPVPPLIRISVEPSGLST